MTTLFVDGFDHYGVDDEGQSAMLDGAWAQLDGQCRPEVPSFGARTGDHALRIQAASGTNDARRVIVGAAADNLFVGFAFYRESLPVANDTCRMLEFADGSNTMLFSLRLQSAGVLEIYDSGETLIATSTTPVITAAAWNYIEINLIIHATTGAVTLKVNEVQKINATGLNTGSINVQQIRHRDKHAGTDTADFWIDDLVVMDDNGSYNNTFQGDMKVVTLFPDEDTAQAGWTARPRKKFGAGIASFAGSGSALSTADHTSFEMGTGDYTLEAFVRFSSLPTGSDRAVIFSKWEESNNDRSFELFKGGPSLNSGALVLRTSSDGTAATVTNVHEWPWVPQLNQWYHIAIDRTSGSSSLYVDGIRLGSAVADATDYYSGDAKFSTGASFSGVAVLTTSSFAGFMDEVRITKGVGRYPAEFSTPTTAFPRSVADGDANFASVSLLAGFDSALADESSSTHTLTVSGTVTAQTTDDGVSDYQTVNQTSPRDDTFIEAALVAATGTLTLTDNALNTETVTLDAQTYTFVAALTGADDVLIGADASATLDNLSAAITGGAGAGTLYGTGTTANLTITASALPGDLMLATAITAGTAGNSLATTETMTAGSWGAATLENGADIPSPSRFGLQSLPSDTVVVRSLTLIHRSSKSDSGTANVQAAFVVADASSANGADNPMTTAPTYREDIFEEDPSTGAALTPSSVTGSSMRLTRTS